LRIKERETRLTLHEYDDDNDDMKAVKAFYMISLRITEVGKPRTV